MLDHMGDSGVLSMEQGQMVQMGLGCSAGLGAGPQQGSVEAMGLEHSHGVGAALDEHVRPGAWGHPRSYLLGRHAIDRGLAVPHPEVMGGLVLEVRPALVIARHDLGHLEARDIRAQGEHLGMGLLRRQHVIAAG